MNNVNNAPTELGTEKISKLLRQYATPAIIAMTASSLYNMVDAIFIGQGVGPLAISGLALTFPFMNMAAAFGTLVGVGASTLVSMLLGQRNYEVANKVLGNVVILNIVIGLLFSAVSLIFLEPILYFFGASEATLPYAKEFMQVILAGNVITHLYFGLNSMLRSSGHPTKAMMATILTVILNIIFAPIFIFVLKLGIKGAAISTVIAQIVALIWLLIIFSNKKGLLHFDLKGFKFEPRIAKDSIAIGMAPFLINFVSCFIVIFINNRLKIYGGDLAIGAYGIVNRIVFIFIMVVMGLTQAMQPIAGYNYGAKQMSRVYEVLKQTMICATVVMTLGFTICELFPRTVISIFTTDTQLIDIAVKGLRLIVVMFPIVSSSIVIGNFFQSIGKPKRAIFLSLSRQLIFLLPALWMLPQLMDMAGIWSSFIVSDFLASVTAALLLWNFVKKNKGYER